jgi:hypothetical protein
MGRLSSLITLWQVTLGVAVAGAVVARLMGGAPALFFLLCAAGAVLVVATVWRALSVHWDPTVAEAEVMDRRATLRYERDLAVQAIKELEADAAAGKVDPKDLPGLRTSAEARALELIRRLREAEESDDLRALQLAHEALGWHADPRCFDDAPIVRIGHRCSACSTEGRAGDRYCRGCGRPVTEAAR